MIDLRHSALSWWKSTFSSSFVAVFWHFLPSKAPIMLYNIRYWWFFRFQWRKYLAHPKIQRPKPCLLMLTSLVTLDGFHLSWLLIWLQSEVVDLFHPLSHIYAKTPFCCVEIVANNALNRWCVVVFDRLWANAAPTLNTAFSLTNMHAKWWIYCLLISSTPLLSHTNSICDWPKRVCGVFWCFSGQLPNLSDLSIQHHLCLYNCV